MSKKSEFANFERMTRALLKVPHSEIKAKLDAEKDAKKQKKSKVSSASREVFHPVRVNLSANVAFRVVDNLVLESVVLESNVGHERIGVNGASGLHMVSDFGLQCVLPAIAHDLRVNFSTTFKNAHDGGFVLGASLSDSALALVGVHEASSATNKGFVYFHFAVRSTELDERASLHRQADAVEHEPRGLLSDAKGAANFVGANTVLAVGNHPNRHQPLVERQSGVLKDGPDFDGELALGVDTLTLPLTLILEEHHILAATGRADHNPVRPAQLDHEVEAIVRVSEVDDCLLEGLGLVHYLHLNQGYPKPVDLSSILLPLQKYPGGPSPVSILPDLR
jgi:hypothetical protein